MSKFNVGDTVRVIECRRLTRVQRAFLGKTGKVTDVSEGIAKDPESEHVYDVEFQNGETLLFYPSKLEEVPQETTPPDEFYFVVKAHEGYGNGGIDYHAKKHHEGDYHISWFANGCPQDSMWDYSTVCGLVNRKAPGIRWEITRVVEQVRDSPEKQPEFKPGDVVERINHGNGLNRAKVGDRGTVVGCRPGFLTVATLYSPHETWFKDNAKLVVEPTLQQLQDAVVSSYAKVAQARKRVEETNDAYNEASRAWDDAVSKSVAAKVALDLELRKAAGVSTEDLM